MKKILILALCLAVNAGYGASPGKGGKKEKKPVTVGAYYFDGWSGTNANDGKPGAEWATGAPSHMTKKLYYDYAGRMPVWGWRNDSQEIMERQIDLAADNGIDFFLFCWYWSDNKGPVNPRKIMEDSKHTSMELYLKARNKDRIGFALLIANHGGSEILGPDNWGDAADFWMQYFSDESYVKVDGKPLLVVFNPRDMEDASIDRMKQVVTAGGLPGLSVAGCGDVSSRSKIDYKTWYNINGGYSLGSEEHQFSELIDQATAAWSGSAAQPCIPTITIGWDKRPWEYEEDGTGLGSTPKGWYYTNRTPKLVKESVTTAIKWLDENPDVTTKERMILMYAWNENGEGGYLMPTVDDPKGIYLKAVRDAVKPYNKR